MRTVPFYFGPDGRLLGVLDRPSDPVDSSGRLGVVICQPIGQEYIRCHRGLRQLASRLVAAGHTVLRFDYTGCGDSAGEPEHARFEEWLDDVASAIAELRLQSRSIAVVGLRLGALLAARAIGDPSHTGRQEVARTVLWEPATDGRSDLAAARREHDALLARYPSRSTPPSGADAPASTELLGYRFANATLQSIEVLDLAPLLDRAGGRTLVLTNRSATSAWASKHAATWPRTVEVEHVDEPSSWIDKPAIVPTKSLDAIVHWLAAAAAR